MEIISSQEAREQGLKRYFTGLVCKNGHTSERLVSNKTCCACHTERQQSPAGKAAQAARNSTPERKAAQAAYAKTPERKAAATAYAKTPERKAAATAYRSTPERKAALAAYRNSAERKAALAAYEKTPEGKAARSAYRKENPAARAAINAQRRAAKLQRTPKWSDRQAIKAIYEHAAFMARVCNEPFHVDHIYPLQGEFVSGLHCPLNLQILTKTENLRKSNRYDPSH